MPSKIAILDNCDHVPAACLELVDGLLCGCPELEVLATTREVLGIGAERVWRVASLPIAEPAPDTPVGGSCEQ
jgi:predicted ATPase